MQSADRKLAWSAVFVLAVIAVEMAIALAIAGPEYQDAHSAATRAAQANGYQDYPWWEYSGAWIALFTVVLTLSTLPFGGSPEKPLSTLRLTLIDSRAIRNDISLSPNKLPMLPNDPSRLRFSWRGQGLGSRKLL